MADTIHTIALGVIEGITEFLPISSTGHLLVAERWLGARSEMFNVVIQAGAILAIVLIYWKRLLGLVTRMNEPQNRDYLAKLIVAFLITAVVGFAIVPVHGPYRMGLAGPVAEHDIAPLRAPGRGLRDPGRCGHVGVA